MKVQFSQWMTQRLSHKFLLTMSIYLLAIFFIFWLLLLRTPSSQGETHFTLKAMSDPTVDASSALQAPLSPLSIRSVPPQRATTHYPLKPLSTIHYPLSTIHYPLSTASCQDCHHLSDASFQKRSIETESQNPRPMFDSHQYLGIGILLSILPWIIMGWFLHRFVLQPVANLLQLGQTSETTLGIPANESSNEEESKRDELGRLTHLFTQMTSHLQARIAEAREQKIFFQALLNAIPDGIRVIDKKYMVVATNQAYHSQLGFPTAIGSTHSGITCYASSHARKHPCPPTLVTCPLHEINKTGQSIKTIMEHTRADGTKLQVEICAAPLQIITNGQTESYIVESVRDLTQSILYSHEQKLASLGQLAAGVAHDIHNPLSSIRLALQSALRSLESKAPNLNSIQHYLHIVDKQIDKCIFVTRRLLKLSSTHSEHPQLVCLKEVVTDTVSLLEYDAKERNIDIQSQFGNAHYRVLAMESDMRMLVLNLLQNAFNAMPQGGHIHVQLRSRAGNVQLSIQDSGVGIPPHILNSIFEPFFSYRPSGKKGSGLGLAICKSIVERHQGRIEVSNTDQRGSQFVVTLPDAQTHSFNQPLAKAV